MKFSKRSFMNKKVEEIDSEGSWAISYGDIITLLLSFFVIFFTTDFKQEKIDKLNRFLLFEIDSLKLENQKNVESQTEDHLKITGLEKFSPEVTPIGDYLVVTFGETSFFHSGRTELTDQGEKALGAFGQKYLPFVSNYYLSVKGFTDNRPVKKVKRRFQDNLELSALRAVSAMRVLQNSGIPLNRMEIAGAGEYQKIKKVVSANQNVDPSFQDALSRKIVLVIKPIKENWP